MKVLDCTIRDGSYSIDFKFTLEDVSIVCERLDKLGIPYIEIGHGLGLKASSPEHGVCLYSDLEYLKTALQAIKTSKIGFFCIPGIATLDDIKQIAEKGVNFIRFGINADEAYKLKDYIECAKTYGIEVMANLMKSYLVSPDDFALAANQCAQQGADYVYIVDSAGTMLPDEITKYFHAIRRLSNVKLGFHGHNNLGLALANSLHCISLGFDMIDATFQGIGRSAGNVSLEQLIMALERAGVNTGIDIPRLLEYGFISLRNIIDKPLTNPLTYACGFAGFHSGFLKYIYACSKELSVDPLRLIISYSKHNKKDLDMDLLRHVAMKLPYDNDKLPYNFYSFFTESDF